MKTVTVILSGYKRKHTTREQVDAFKNQSYPVNIVYFANGKFDDHPTDYEFLEKSNVTLIESSVNQGVWGRFAAALNFDTDFYCVIDDDMIPGSDFIKTCVECYEEVPGIYGGHGVRDRAVECPIYKSPYNHHGWVQLLWNMNGPSKPLHVAYLCNCWFFPKVALHNFWAESVSSEQSCNKLAGEDIHLSLMALKYSGLKSYVIPATRFTPSKLLNIAGLKYSEDANALSKDAFIMSKSRQYYHYAVSQGLPVFKMETYTDNDGEFWE